MGACISASASLICVSMALLNSNLNAEFIPLVPAISLFAASIACVFMFLHIYKG